MGIVLPKYSGYLGVEINRFMSKPAEQVEIITQHQNKTFFLILPFSMGSVFFKLPRGNVNGHYCKQFPNI